MIRIFKSSTKGNVTPVFYKQFTFSGGEEYISINDTVNSPHIRIEADLRNSRSILQLLLIKNALDTSLVGRKQPIITLVLSYLPYARQDRVCNTGESHSLKVMCNLINSMEFDEVITYDVHSDVALGLVNNITNISQASVIGNMPSVREKILSDKAVIIAPDGGAMKKSLDVVKSLIKEEPAIQFSSASKIRDTITGDIVETRYDGDPAMITDENVWIIDDICDGGRTFLELAKVLRIYEPKSINLVVTNGIFSKGINVLKEEFDSVHALFDWTAV